MPSGRPRSAHGGRHKPALRIEDIDAYRGRIRELEFDTNGAASGARPHGDQPKAGHVLCVDSDGLTDGWPGAYSAPTEMKDAQVRGEAEPDLSRSRPSSSS